MSIVLYTRKGEPVGVRCRTAVEAVELLRVVTRADYAADEHDGAVVACRATRRARSKVASARRASPGVLEGQLALVPDAALPLVPRLVR